MAADRALDAVGVRGASGGRGYCWPPAAPPHQQVPTWGRPIHEVGAVGRSGGEAGGAYRRLHAREGGGHHVPLSPAFIPEFLLVRWRESWLHHSGALYLARSTRSGIASPHHTFPPEPGLQSLSEWQIPTVVLWEGGQKASMLPHREGSCLCQFWEFQNLLQNWHLPELKLKLLALKRISNLVLCKLLFPGSYIQH